MDELKKDARFSHIPKDPRFRPASKSERKLKIDRRFSSMFKDPKFKLKYTVDKRGRPLLKERTTRDDMKKFYHLDENEEESSSTSSDEEKDEKKKKKITTGDEQLDEILQSDDTDEEEEQPELEEEEINQSSSSEDEETPELDDDVEWNDFDEKCVRSDEMSHRLAVCNMDWDRVRASDIFVLLNSWKSPDGVIKSVTVYPSEYGLKQMEAEKLHGPLPDTIKPVELNKPNGTDSGHQSEGEDEPELPEIKSDDDEEIQDENINQDDDADVTDPKIRERLRKYQLNRLKYYYAVVECDSVETAARIYEECDGLEYETSAVRIDIRFIPDSMTFNETDVRDRCTELPDKSIYKPILFRNTALTQTKVRCTWDETPLDRRLLTRKKYTEEELKKISFDEYLATESEDDLNDEDDDNDNVTSDLEDEENSAKEKKDENDIFKVPNVPDDENKKSKKDRPIMRAPSVLSSQDDIERYRALLLGLDDDSESKKKKSKKKITNFFDDEHSDDDDELIRRRTEPDDDDDDDDDPSDVDMEITWQPGLKSKENETNTNKKETNKKNKKDKRSSKEEEEETNDVAEENDQAKFNKDSLELLTVGEESESKRDYNLRQMIKAHRQTMKAEEKKKKNPKKSMKKSTDEQLSEDKFQLNVDDQRFSAVFNQPAFNIDQSDPNFKPTAGTQRIIEEKLKKRKFEQKNDEFSKRNDHEDLVARLKRKSARKD